MTLPIIRYLTAILLALCIILPTVLQSAKTAILGIIVALSISHVIKNNSKLNISYYLLSIPLFFSLFGIIYVIIGIIRNNPGAIPLASVHVVYPLIFSYLSVFCAQGDLEKIVGLFVKFGNLLILSQLLFFASVLGVDGGFFSGIILSMYEGIAVADAGDDYLALSMPSTASIFFILPLTIISYLYKTKSTPFLLFSIYAYFGIAAMSGRRAFLVSIVLAVAVTMLLASIIWRNFNFSASRFLYITFAPIIIFFYLIYSGLISFDLIFNNVISTFDFKTDESNIERTLQFISMIREIQISPIFGNGAGAAAPYIRNPIMPWAYELHYIHILFSFGMIGFIIYSLGILWILCMLYNIAKKHAKADDKIAAANYLSVFSGLLCFIISAATNPYLVKFDYMWVIFVPFALISEEMLRVKRSRSRERIY